MGHANHKQGHANHKHFRLPRWVHYLVLLLFSCGICVAAIPSLANAPTGEVAVLVAQASLQSGEQLYNAGKYSEAAAVLEQVAQQAQAAGKVAEQVTALRNLALVYQAMGQWQKANQAIATALPLVNKVDAPNRSALQASLLEVQGSLQFEQGQNEAALTSWEEATQRYRQARNQTKAIQNQINQAQALQRLGFYRRTIELLTPLVQAQAKQPDSLNQAAALQRLGEAEQFVGNLEQARKHVTTSLEIAKRLSNSTANDFVARSAIATAELTLGNILQAEGKQDEALAQYQRVVNASVPDSLRLQAQLNQLRLLITMGKVSEATALWPQIQTYLDNQPASHTTLFARINLAQSLLQLKGAAAPPAQTIAQILAVAVQQARSLQDQRGESYALGILGSVYEQTGQWAEAQKLSGQALLLAQSQRASDIAYRWQWQLGRLYKVEGDRQNDPASYGKALTAYGEAVKTLQSLRTDLAATNAQVQISFQDSVEPVHREFVSLLLDPRRGEANSADLERALTTIESLQLAELDNFFREACLKATPVNISQVDQQAAVIYPIVLPDRMEVIVSLPNQKLRHYTSVVQQTDFEQTVNQLRQSLVIRVGNQYLTSVQKLYDWIVRPTQADLAASQVKTLVFVLDSQLRNLPMAALHDGKQFLIENYSVALTPGMQLLNPKPVQESNLDVLTAGLSEARQGFSALPQVPLEVKEIQANVPTKVLLNQSFTEVAFRKALGARPAPIVHLATHGKFSSNKEDTFVLTWDEKLNIESLNGILQESDLDQTNPIELLVLSACETATGDKLAALGMAGMAVRAGARSTVASLWQINDEATAMLMNQFYEGLATRKMTKAEALRQAQLVVLKEPRFRQHPYFWAPYVLVGNWL